MSFLILTEGIFMVNKPKSDKATDYSFYLLTGLMGLSFIAILVYVILSLVS